MLKYDPLKRHLDAQTAPSVVMSFHEIESVIGSALPEPASKYAESSANANPATKQHPYSQAWTSLGWRARANLTAGTVLFERVSK
jgi:hypothetical protein